MNRLPADLTAIYILNIHVQPRGPSSLYLSSRV